MQDSNLSTASQMPCANLYTSSCISGGALLWQLPHLPRCLCPVTDDTGYLYSLTRGVPTATPFHGCTSTVAHLSRPIGVFATFATVTISHLSRPYTSWPGWAPVESNHPVVIFTLGDQLLIYSERLQRIIRSGPPLPESLTTPPVDLLLDVSVYNTMGGVCCPTLMSNASLRKVHVLLSRVSLQAFSFDSVCLIRLLATRETTNYYPLGGVFLQQQNHKNMCVVSAQSASWSRQGQSKPLRLLGRQRYQPLYDTCIIIKLTDKVFPTVRLGSSDGDWYSRSVFQA